MLWKINHFNWFICHVTTGMAAWRVGCCLFLPIPNMNNQYLSFQKELQDLPIPIWKRILAKRHLLWSLCSYLSIKIVNIDQNKLHANRGKRQYWFKTGPVMRSQKPVSILYCYKAVLNNQVKWEDHDVTIAQTIREFYFSSEAKSCFGNIMIFIIKTWTTWHFLQIVSA